MWNFFRERKKRKQLRNLTRALGVMKSFAIAIPPVVSCKKSFAEVTNKHTPDFVISKWLSYHKNSTSLRYCQYIYSDIMEDYLWLIIAVSVTCVKIMI